MENKLTPELKERFENILDNCHDRIDNNVLISLMHAAYNLDREWVSVGTPPEIGQVIDTWNGITNRRCVFTKNGFERHVDMCKWDRALSVVCYPDVTHWRGLPQKPNEL